MAETDQTSGTKRRLNRRDWLARALHLLAQKGVDGVRVEPLARVLNVTKGSFYWHFKDRQELLDALIEYWVETQTLSVIDEIGAMQVEPKARLEALVELVTDRQRARFDPPIRSWAARDKKVAKVVETVDRQRFDFVLRIFQAAGFRGEDAELRTRILIYYQLGEALGLLDGPKERHAFIAPRIRFLLRE